MSSIPSNKDVLQGALLYSAFFIILYLIIPETLKSKMGIVAFIFIIGGFLMIAQDRAQGKGH